MKFIKSCKVLIIFSTIICTSCNERGASQKTIDFYALYMLCVDAYTNDVLDKYKVSIPSAVDVSIQKCEEMENDYLQSILKDVNSADEIEITPDLVERIRGKIRGETKYQFVEVHEKRGG